MQDILLQKRQLHQSESRNQNRSSMVLQTSPSFKAKRGEFPCYCMLLLLGSLIPISLMDYVYVYSLPPNKQSLYRLARLLL